MGAVMPELLTKDPDVVLELLKSQGAQCGVGIMPRTLTSCPQEKFCMLQDGELCVYGAQELGLMTQLTREDVCGPLPAPMGSTMPRGPSLGIGLAVAAVLGFAVATSRARRRKA